MKTNARTRVIISVVFGIVLAGCSSDSIKAVSDAVVQLGNVYVQYNQSKNQFKYRGEFSPQVIEVKNLERTMAQLRTTLIDWNVPTEEYLNGDVITIMSKFPVPTEEKLAREIKGFGIVIPVDGFAVVEFRKKP